MSATRIRASKAGNSRVGENSLNAMRDNKSTEATSWGPWTRPSGVHPPQPGTAFIGSLLAEFAGVLLLGFCVAAVRWCSTSNNLVLNGAFVALTYGGVYYALTRMLTFNHVFRRHLNPYVTALYWVFGQIGFSAAVGYWIMQTVGMIIGGVSLQVLLSASPNPGVLADLNIAVPYATSGGAWSMPTNRVLAVVLEFVFSAVLMCVLFLIEFVNKDPTRGDKNYKRATTAMAIALVAIVTALFPFQAYTFSPVVYGVGLMSGSRRDADDTRYTNNLAQMDPAMYAGSIWASGGAWANYIFTPFAGAILAFLIIVFTFWLNGIDPRKNSARAVVDPWLSKKFGSTGLVESEGDHAPPVPPADDSDIKLQVTGSSIYKGAEIQTQMLRHPTMAQRLL